MSTPTHAELVRFVRETMGCSCPDDVLAHIEFSPGQLPVLYRLDVGGRLLVHLVDEGCVTGPDFIIGLLGAGKAERDALGFNRFRLGIMAAEPQSLGMLLQAMGEISRLDGLDDRVHLHVIRRDSLL